MPCVNVAETVVNMRANCFGSVHTFQLVLAKTILESSVHRVKTRVNSKNRSRSSAPVKTTSNQRLVKCVGSFHLER